MRKLTFTLLLLVALVLVAAPSAKAWDCYSYSGSSVTNFGPYSWGCAGTGGSCRECTNFHPGGYQVCWEGSGFAGGYVCIDYAW